MDESNGSTQTSDLQAEYTWTSEASLNRCQVARLLGITETEVRRREKMGHLIPARTEGRSVYYTQDQVDAEAQRQPARKKVTYEDIHYSGFDAAKILEERDAGATMIQCVRKHAFHPDKVEAIYKRLAQLEGGLLLSKKSMDILNTLPLDGMFPIPNEEALVEMIKLAAEEKACHGCRMRPRSMCQKCALKFGQKTTKTTRPGEEDL